MVDPDTSDIRAAQEADVRSAMTTHGRDVVAISEATILPVRIVEIRMAAVCGEPPPDFLADRAPGNGNTRKLIAEFLRANGVCDVKKIARGIGRKSAAVYAALRKVGPWKPRDKPHPQFPWITRRFWEFRDPNLTPATSSA